MFRNKLTTGYEKKPKNLKKRSTYVGKLFIKHSKSMNLGERLVKFLIYISLRLAIHPKKWKNPEKNYEIIDRTYKVIMSPDFVFIPSSIAFYLIMAFMPIISMITIFYQIPGINEIFLFEGKDLLKNSLKNFIPGISIIIEQLKEISKLSRTNSFLTETVLGTSLVSLLVSTWIASNGFSQLIFTQSHIFEHKFFGNYWSNKFKGMLIVFLISFLLFLGLFINVTIQRQIELSSLSEFSKNAFLNIFTVIILFLGLFGLSILIFKYSPRFRIKIKHILPGATVTTVPSALFLAIFSSITSWFSYGAYGTIGTIMYVCMGSLIITYFVFLGIIANASYYKTFVGTKVESK